MLFRSPSFFMSQNIPELNSTYRADPNLVAPVLNHFRFSVKRTGRALRKAGEILPPNFFEAALFVSNMQRYIYFDTQMQPKQAPLGQLYSWGGVDMNFKVRLLKKIYIENLLTFQSGVVLDSTSELENLFSRMLPGVNGKLSIYYETSDIKIADYLRIGGSMNYTGIYEGLIFDPVSQEFYPSKEPRTGPSYYPYAEAGSIFQWSGYYPRFDVFAVVRIKSATLYAKVLHVNDGWTFVPAYFSTPFYPMIKRSFLFGVNWSFLD